MSVFSHFKGFPALGVLLQSLHIAEEILSLTGGPALKFFMPFIDFPPLKMFRLENASPPLKMCIFSWWWRVNPLKIFTFYSNVPIWRNLTSEMPQALWSFPLLCWILQDPDPLNLVCCWNLYFGFVAFFKAIPKSSISGLKKQSLHNFKIVFVPVVYMSLLHFETLGV